MLNTIAPGIYGDPMERTLGQAGFSASPFDITSEDRAAGKGN